MAYGSNTTPIVPGSSGQQPGALPGATATIPSSTFQDGSSFSSTGVAQNQQAQNALGSLGVTGSAYNSFVPPNTNSPVSTNMLSSGAINIPPATPSPDPTGSNLVAGVAATVGASQPGQSDTPQLDNALGLGTQSANSLFNNTQTPDQTTAQNNINQGIQQYGNLSSQVGTQAADTQAAYQQYGVTGDLQKVNDITTQLANLNAQYNNAAQNSETQGINSGTPSVVYQGQQAAIQRQQAVQQGSLAAQLSAAQGNYQNAKQLADQTVSLKYQDLQDKLTATQNFLSLNKDNLSNLEQQQANKIQAAVQQQQTALDQQKAVSSLAIQYPTAGIDANGSLVSATQKASAFIAQNPTAGQKPVVIGSSLDSNGNKIDVYGLVGANGQITPVDYNSSTGNNNFGMSVGTIQGLPSYNTAANNPGVSRPVRNNNPGNIKVSGATGSYPGVVGVESTSAADGGNFLIFDNPQDGLNAIGQLLQGPGYANMTAAQAIKRYNGGGSYSASDLGLDPNTDLQAQLKDPSTLQTVLQNLATHEGFSTQSGTSGNAVGTTGSPTIDTSSPAYSSALVGSTGLTQSAIDQNALKYATTGTMPALGNGSTGQIKIAKQAIIDRAAELNAGGNIEANKAQIGSLSSSLSTQQSYLDTTTRALNTANSNLSVLQSYMSKYGLNSSSVPIINQLNNAVKSGLTDAGTIAAFNTQIQDLRSEYAQVLAKGGTVTDTSRGEATSLIPDNISPAQLQQVATQIQADGQNAVSSAKQQVDTITGQINQIGQKQSATQYPAGTVIQYQGKNYTVDAQGNLTPQ